MRQTANSAAEKRISKFPSCIPLLEVCLEGETEEEPFLLEVTTYPQRRVSQQMTDDLLLV